MAAGNLTKEDMHVILSRNTDALNRAIEKMLSAFLDDTRDFHATELLGKKVLDGDIASLGLNLLIKVTALLQVRAEIMGSSYGVPVAAIAPAIEQMVLNEALAMAKAQGINVEKIPGFGEKIQAGQDAPGAPKFPSLGSTSLFPTRDGKPVLH